MSQCHWDNGCLYGRGTVLEGSNALQPVTAHHKFQVSHRKKPSGVTSGEHYHQQTQYYVLSDKNNHLVVYTHHQSDPSVNV
jgi:hypothetical protein